MKKILLVGLSLLLAVNIAACSKSNEEKKTAAAEQKVLRVGATGQSFPNSYKEGEKLAGFDVDVIETVAKNLNYKVEWTLADFSGIMGQLESDKLDTIANAVGVTEERKKKYDFSEAYSYAGTQIVTHKDNTSINTLEDIKGKTVAGVLGSNNVTNLQKYDKNGELKIKTYETRDGAMNDLINKRIEGYVNARSALLAEIQKRNLPFKFVGNPVAYESVAFPFAKNEKGQEFLKKTNEELKKLRDDGTLKKLSEKYFGEDITVKAN